MRSTPTSDAAVESALTALAETRERTHELVSRLDERQLESVHSTLLSPLVWDLGHIAAFEDLWISRVFEVELLRPELIAVYDADETPRAERGSLPMLLTEAAFEFQRDVRERTVALLETAGGQLDTDRIELIVRHEQQHNETMLQTLQIARLPTPFGGDGSEIGSAERQTGEGVPSGLEPVPITAGEVEIGAAPDGFAYDNERPRHLREVGPFRIGRTSVTNGEWLEFIDRGGYDRREWWSDEGWTWRTETGAGRPLAWTEDGRRWRLQSCVELDPSEPVIHVSFHEAEAFANAYGARLPTELEWERCASAGRGSAYPWGEDEPGPGRANVDQRAGGPVAAGSLAGGASPEGVLGLIGDVWEWTSTWLYGYSGFVAYPYREYSEQFFGTRYRVLRGGSWATRPRMANAHFRNWDLPQRRQIFSGVRLAWDAER